MNPYAIPPACPKCNDTRTLTKYTSARPKELVPCPDCGSLTPEEYDRFRKDAWTKRQPQVGICELDLTPEEFKTYTRLRAENPDVSKLTVLGWIESDRYDPAKDPEFLKEAREEFRKWQAGMVERHAGIKPEWLVRKLAGLPVEINRSQELFFKAWVEKYGDQK